MTAAAPLIPYLLPAAVGIGGSLIQGALQRSAYKDADKERARLLQRQFQNESDTRRENLQALQEGHAQFDPATRAQNLQAAEAEAGGELSDYLSVTEARDTAGSKAGGKVTQNYGERSADKLAEDLRFGRDYAQLVGRASAPGLLSQREGFRLGQTAAERLSNNTDQGVQSRIGQLQIENVQPDGGKLALGDAIGSLSTLYAGSKLSSLGGTPSAGTMTSKSPRFAPGTTSYWTNGKR